jgi:Tol biopolymer transport system component
VRAVLFAIVLAGCRINFDTIDLDAATADHNCWPAWRAHAIRFATPRVVDELGPGSRANTSLSRDGLTLYFVQSNDLWFATRRARDLPWENATQLTTLDTSSSEQRLSTSGDGTIGVFASDRGGTLDLWYATRTAPGDAFGSATQGPVAAANVPPGRKLDPELTADGLHLYFAPFNSPMQSIMLATRTTTLDPFGPPVAVSELSITSAIGDPSVSPDELVIAFSSGLTMPENDLFYSVRGTTTDKFGTPTPIDDLDLPGVDEHDITLASDGCELYFNSDRSGTLRLYVATAL